MNQFIILLQLFLISIQKESVKSHGILMEPIARGSRWRFNESAPIDYNDNEAFCGGFGIQWSVNNGKCGVCGDNYADKIPRAHEYGGIYGEPVIVQQYRQETEIFISVRLTANHRGYFKFDICNMDESNENEICFQKNQLQIKNAGYKYELQVFIPAWFETIVLIPKNLKCEHCVLRWTYVTGNNWGNCEDGSSGMGCGPQENYKACADIAII